jgi:23S rRNA (adenine2503-C2)-methyltransferase
MDGLRRNLTLDEILEQVIHARREMPIDRVVFMGMGEPSHNLEVVLAAVESIRALAWISPRKQTFSTVGSFRTLEALSAARQKPCLALSLHSADAAVRADLLVNAPREPLRELVLRADAYGRLMRIPVQFEWTLLAGINDRESDMDALCELLRGVRGYVNFIRWNRVAGQGFEPTPADQAFRLRELVKARGILATVRAATGADVDGACGQLRRRSLAGAGP